MRNPILGAVNQSRLASQMQPIKSMMQAVRSAQNPQAMLNQMIQNNPQYSQISRLIQESGGDPQKAFYALANQLGVDPGDVLNMLK